MPQGIQAVLLLTRQPDCLKTRQLHAFASEVYITVLGPDAVLEAPDSIKADIVATMIRQR